MIKAIETEYKGYRMRSRLEARWAVFFDAIGADWKYEVEGLINDDGIKYLPDFELNRTNIHKKKAKVYVEIKSGDQKNNFKNIYLAGKMMDQDHGKWRQKYLGMIGNRFQEFQNNSPEYITHKMRSYDFEEQFIVNMCLTLINDSDIVFANIDTLNTVGTFIELGYAKAKNKTIVTYFKNNKIAENAWFAAGLSKKYQIGGDPIDLFDGLLIPITKEFTKCRMAVKNSNFQDRSLVLLRGDPMDCSIVTFIDGFENDWGNDLIGVCRSYFGVEDTKRIEQAAQKARSARFEFGENG